MRMKSLALVANFHRERRIGRKTAAFIGAVHARLLGQGIRLNVEFVLDCADELTHRLVEGAAVSIDGARLHVVDFGNLGKSRTHGVHAARSDVVCFTDGDDFFSFNWFEAAFEYLSKETSQEIVHTQYMIGFDKDKFIRETMDSDHQSFDPLSLAVDWYWSANLAMQTKVFAAVPILPYDHAGGFGSEDWHWACNSLAAGIRRRPLPNTSYFYRVKPGRFALGRVPDVIHMRSPLFTREGAPPPPRAPSERPAATHPLSPVFFSQAREIETFDLGTSYLRAVEVGALPVRRFSPHTPPIVGSVMREVLASGFGDRSTVVFADVERLAGGLKTARDLCSALFHPPGAPRLYIVDGEGCEHHVSADGCVVSVGELKGAGLNEDQIERLIARFLIQQSNLTVLNLLSPRARSKALAFNRATRGGVQLWLNVVMEYGFDALSQSYDELDAYAKAGIESRNIGLFQKTVREAARVRGAALLYRAELELDYVSGALGRRMVSPPVEGEVGLAGRGSLSAAEPRTYRITSSSHVEAGRPDSRGLVLRVTDWLRTLAATEEECIFAFGGCFLGANLGESGQARAPGLRIPALTVIDQVGQPTLYLRHPVERFDSELQTGRFPADIGAVGAIGIDCRSLREMLLQCPESLSLTALLQACLRRAWDGGGACISTFGPTSIVAVSEEDLGLIDKSLLARTLARAGGWSGVRA